MDLYGFYLTRRWFYPAWIIQGSFVHPNTIIRCGEADMSFDRVLSASFIMRLLQCQCMVKSVGQRFKALSLLFIKSTLRVGQCERAPGLDNSPLLCLLSQPAASHATNLQDKGFVLVSLANNVQPTIIDYHNDFGTILINASVEMVQSTLENRDTNFSALRLITCSANTQLVESSVRPFLGVGLFCFQR